MIGAAGLGGNVGICVKSRDWIVTAQNASCRQICGDLAGQNCQRSCWRFWKETALVPCSEIGIHAYRHKLVNERTCDVAVIFGSESITSVLCPLEGACDTDVIALKKRGFTKREIEIILARKRGYKNIEIEFQLGISHSTLKTHIANIRRKLNSQGVARYCAARF